jgi:hypothetical protein
MWQRTASRSSASAAGGGNGSPAISAEESSCIPCAGDVRYRPAPIQEAKLSKSGWDRSGSIGPCRSQFACPRSSCSPAFSRNNDAATRCISCQHRLCSSPSFASNNCSVCQGGYRHAVHRSPSRGRGWRHANELGQTIYRTPQETRLWPSADRPAAHRVCRICDVPGRYSHQGIHCRSMGHRSLYPRHEVRAPQRGRCLLVSCTRRMQDMKSLRLTFFHLRRAD